MTELELRVPVAAPAGTTWAAMTDWTRQGGWVRGTGEFLVDAVTDRTSEFAAFAEAYGR